MSSTTVCLHHERLATAAATLIVCLLAACSRSAGPGHAGSSGARVNPCSVLARGDILAALGAAPEGEGRRDNMGVVDRCSWGLPSGADVNVTFFNPVGAATLYAAQVSSRRPRDRTYEPVHGLGDQAVYRDDSSPPAISVSESVEVVQGKQHFELHYVDAGAKASAPPKDSLVSLARAVAAHVS